MSHALEANETLPASRINHALEANENNMGQCSCTNIMRCTEIQKHIISNGNELMYGSFDIRQRTSDKISAFRKKCIYHLGLGTGKLTYLRIRKLHFNPNVLRYLENNKKYPTTPISWADAIREDLMDFTTPYRNRMLLFIPNQSYSEVNALLNLIPNVRKRKIIEIYKVRDIINGKEVTDNLIDDNDCAGTEVSIESEKNL